MRAPMSDLPLVLDDVSLQAGATTILDRLSLTIAPGAPTLIVGPNGAGKATLLRLCMGLAQSSAGRSSWGRSAGPTAGGKSPRVGLSRALARRSTGRSTWGARPDSTLRRRAILFQRPV